MLVLTAGADLLSVVTTRPVHRLSGAVRCCAQTARLLDFWRNYRAVHTTIVHFQLRNLVWATSSHDVYVMLDSCINHWSIVDRHITQVGRRHLRRMLV